MREALKILLVFYGDLDKLGGMKAKSLPSRGIQMVPEFVSDLFLKFPDEIEEPFISLIGINSSRGLNPSIDMDPLGGKFSIEIKG